MVANPYDINNHYKLYYNNIKYHLMYTKNLFCLVHQKRNGRNEERAQRSYIRAEGSWRDRPVGVDALPSARGIGLLHDGGSDDVI